MFVLIFCFLSLGPFTVYVMHGICEWSLQFVVVPHVFRCVVLSVSPSLSLLPFPVPFSVCFYRVNNGKFLNIFRNSFKFYQFHPEFLMKMINLIIFTGTSKAQDRCCASEEGCSPSRLKESRSKTFEKTHGSQIHP